MEWEPLLKPAEMAEHRLIDAILSGKFPIFSNLPGERELAERIGVTRPTLREVLQRLARDGWLDIQHGKPTRIRDYWRDGGLQVLAVLARTPTGQSPFFVTYLLEIRVLLAPVYARQAIESSPSRVAELLLPYSELKDDPVVFAMFDWDLHIQLTQLASNPVFRFLFNGFQELSMNVGKQYFSFPECRQHSRSFYHDLSECAILRSAADAEILTHKIMVESQALWQKSQVENHKET